MSNLLLSKIGHVISEFPLAFKQTKEVKLFMTLLVKNEEGMLEENLQFHKAMGVDGFIITDNNSTDSTPDIIRKYKQKGWIKEVIEEKATNYEQKDWVDRMIWKAKTIYKGFQTLSPTVSPDRQKPVSLSKGERKHKRSGLSAEVSYTVSH